MMNTTQRGFQVQSVKDLERYFSKSPCALVYSCFLEAIEQLQFSFKKRNT